MLGYFSSVDDERVFHGKLAWGIIYAALPTFLTLYFLIPSPWGKTASHKTAHLLGPLVPARPAWFFFESPNLVLSFLCFVNRRHRQLDRFNLLLLSLFVLHYIQRSIFYPLWMSSRRKKLPLAAALSAFVYCTINGYLQAQSLCEFESYGNSLEDDPILLLGIVVFLVGAAINLHSDSILRKLSAPDGRYRIPQGGAFEYVSAAHFWGEIVEWGGFAVACRSVAATSFFLFTLANLIPRAVAHHKWYRQTFWNSYPKQRKAVIPYVW